MLAESVKAPRPDSTTSSSGRIRTGALYGQLTGYYSRIYGRTALEQSMNPYLSGDAPELAVSNFSDLVLGQPQEGRHRRDDRSAPTCRRRPSGRSGAYQGAVVAMRPGTGDVLALVSNPGYDPNPLSHGHRPTR